MTEQLTPLLDPPTGSATAKREFVGGMRAMLPMLASVAPFGLVLGVTMGASHISPAAAWSTSWLIYGGSAQLATINALNQGASAIVVLAGVLAINARLALYSSALAPYWRGASRGWRALAAYLVIDPSFLVGIAGYTKRRSAGHAYFMGGAVILWVFWQLTILAGLSLGTAVPDDLQLDFIVPLYLLALIVPDATTASIRIGALAAAVVSVAASFAPFNLGLSLGILAGIAAGLIVKERNR
jgi:predicted branched-subunit amino acid permease